VAGLVWCLLLGYLAATSESLAPLGDEARARALTAWHHQTSTYPRSGLSRYETFRLGYLSTSLGLKDFPPTKIVEICHDILALEGKLQYGPAIESTDADIAFRGQVKVRKTLRSWYSVCFITLSLHAITTLKYRTNP
jgi:hypothetical protein